MTDLPPPHPPIRDRVTVADTYQEQKVTPPSHLDLGSLTVTLVSSGDSSVSPVPIASAEVEQEFRQLASDWLRETAYDSDPADKFLHRAHLKLIAMGEKILPLALEETEKMSGHWFVLLDAISPYNPVGPQDEMSLERTSQAWLRWGKEEGLI